MNLLQSRTWGITMRLVLVATVPALVLFAVVSASLYYSSSDEVEQTIIERGHLISTALAETSQYGVVSGNLSYLDRIAQQLLKTDSSIASIEVFDNRRRSLVALGNLNATGTRVFERPIGNEVPDVNLFDQNGPHVSGSAETQTSFRPGQTAGLVRVSMSSAPVYAAKRGRLFLSALSVFGASLLSGLLGLYLAQRLRAPLSAVMVALRRIRQGDYSVRLETYAKGELGELQQAIVMMAEQLSVTKQEQDDEIALRTQELRLAVQRASAADAEKRRLIARTNAALEDERKRIAVEIHDDLNASLIVLRLKAQHIAALASAGSDQNQERDSALAEIGRTALAISSTTEDLYASARNIVKQLRPEVIDTLGLKGAAREMVRHYDELYPKCRFSLHVDPEFPDLRDQLAITAYRLVQEALTNVVKHADATCADVRLESRPDAHLLLITVEDDGKGFDRSQLMPDRMGLVGMRERVSTAGGEIDIDSTRGEGTKLSIRLPVSDSDASTSNFGELSPL